MPTQHNRDEDMGAVTLNNTLRNPFPASPFGFSPRAPSLGVEGQSNRPSSQAGVAMSPKAGVYPMVGSIFFSSTDTLSVVTGSVT